MERALSNQTSENQTMVAVTPEILRELATRLESTSEAAQDKQYSLVSLTPQIKLCFKRESGKILKLTTPETDNGHIQM